MRRQDAILVFDNDRGNVELIPAILGDLVRYVHLPRNTIQLFLTAKTLEPPATTSRLGFPCRFG